MVNLGFVDLTDGGDLFLTFDAQFDLEQNTDAVLVEFSNNNGVNWETMGAITGNLSTWAKLYGRVPEKFWKIERKLKFQKSVDFTHIRENNNFDILTF